MLLESVVRLEGMRILDLTYTHEGHPPHRGRMTSVESLQVDNKILVVTEERAKGDLPTTRSLSTLNVIAGSNSPALGPPDISLRRLHQQGKYMGDKTQKHSILSIVRRSVDRATDKIERPYHRT